jgi:hypothetical protein
MTVIRRYLSGTTLVAPWLWALLAIWLIPAVELLGTLAGNWPAGQWDAWRFIAGTAALCPGIAVMGAKRPQDRAWKFIVASLWGVLALPAAKVLVLPAANTLTLHPAQAWFLLALVSLGVLNWLPTRFGVAALLAGAGLLLLLAGHLPLLPTVDGPVRSTGSLACFLIAQLWVVSRLTSGATTTPDPRTRLWLEFRDLFGAFWSLRVAERWNAVAAERHWPMLLGWRGFYGLEPATPEGVCPPDGMEEGDRALHSLLRRFVDREWIARRTGGGPTAAADDEP